MRPQTKRFIVDMVALNLFIVCVAFIVEVVISGISWSVFWRGRLIMIIPNIITVEPYNRTRIWFDTKFRRGKNTYLRSVIRDTFVFIIFRVPLVFIVLSILGTPMHNVLLACASATMVSGFTGRPYGIFLDWMRARFGVRPATHGHT